jgi:glycosyltransferase involved in cell wall biosynthesis
LYDLYFFLSREYELTIYSQFQHENENVPKFFRHNYIISNISKEKSIVSPYGLYKLLKKQKDKETIIYRPLSYHYKLLYFLNLLFISTYSFLKKKNLIIYEQIDLHGSVKVDRKFELFKKVFPGLKYVTPISSSQNFHLQRIKDTFFIPFLVNIRISSNEIKKNNRIVFVGKLFEQRKRFDIVLEIVQYFFKKNMNLKFLIIGFTDVNFNSIESSYLFKKFIDLGVEIKLNIQREHVMQEYRISDILVYPSEHERAGVSPLEASANGVIPILFDGENKMNLSSNYFQNKINCFSVQENNYIKYCDVINYLYSNNQILYDYKKKSLLHAAHINTISKKGWNDLLKC